MNFSSILEWTKQYLAIVICVVLAIVAIVVLPMLSSGWNDSVKDIAKSRNKYFGDIKRLQATDFQVPGGLSSGTTVINRQLLNRYSEITSSIREDSEALKLRAREHNKKSHDILMPELFPNPPEGGGAMEVLPKQFHEKVLEAYGEILGSMNAGMPPAVADVQSQLEAERRQFLEQMMAKDETDSLSQEEEKQLAQQMTWERLEIYKDRAGEISVYLSMDSLSPPRFDRSSPPTLEELFGWQWRIWVLEEVADVVRSLNEGRAEPVNPIKRIEHIHFSGLMEMTHMAGSAPPGGAPKPAPSGGRLGTGGGGPMRGGGGPSRGGGPGHGAPPGGGKASSSPALAVANAPPAGSTNYDVSLSGRISNALYDVVNIHLTLVVETRAVPEILDAFAKQNFMNVIDLRITPVDAFDAIREGYFYGGENVASLELTLDTIWLRSWTSTFMPDVVRASLGIPLPPKQVNASGGPGGAKPAGPPGRPGTGPGGRP